jgi:hypothetical protein
VRRAEPSNNVFQQLRSNKICEATFSFMGDPFLAAHRIDTAIFDISSGLRPGSVRDQIIRATLIVRRAHESTLIDPSRELVVVGAGAAGTAAALFAARAGITTTLIDSDAAFSRQLSSNRMLEPTLYDWPADHWDRGEFPWHEEYAPLAYKARPARDVATDWASKLARAEGDLLHYLHSTRLERIVRVTDDPCMYAVETVSSRSGPLTIPASMIILALGPGAEKIEVGTGFRSFRFWDADPLGSDPLTLRNALIAGSGDGALQDVLRLVLKPDADLEQVISALNVPAELLRRVQTIASQADANFVWSATSEHEHRSERFVHLQIEEVVTQFWNRQQDHITRVLDDYCRDAPPRITIAFPCEHFSRGFPINRVVTMLVLRWCKIRNHEMVLLPNTKIASVDCMGGSHLTPTDCCGAPHRVTFDNKYCEATAPGAHCQWTPADKYDLILLRVGTKPEDLTMIPIDPAFEEQRRHRQVLPAHLAHEDYSSVGL